MNGTMNAAVMEGIGKMGYTRRPIPTPKADEVLVKLEYVGICGSDMHYWEKGVTFHTDAVQAAGHLPVDVKV